MGPIDALIYNAGNGVWKKYDEITVDQVSVRPVFPCVLIASLMTEDSALNALILTPTL